MRLDANDYRGKASGVRIGQVRTNTKRPDGGVGAHSVPVFADPDHHRAAAAHHEAIAHTGSLQERQHHLGMAAAHEKAYEQAHAHTHSEGAQVAAPLNHQRTPAQQRIAAASKQATRSDPAALHKKEPRGAPGAVMRGHLAAPSERGQRAARAVQRGRKGGAYTVGPGGKKHYIGKGK